MTKNTRTWIRMTVSLFLTVFVVYYAIISAYAHVHVVNGGERRDGSAFASILGPAFTYRRTDSGSAFSYGFPFFGSFGTFDCRYSVSTYIPY